MTCPQCGAWVRVLETRKREPQNTYRRYECANLHRFTTREIQVEKKGRIHGART